MMGFLANLFNRTLEPSSADSWNQGVAAADAQLMTKLGNENSCLWLDLKYTESLNDVLRNRLDRIAATDKGSKMMRQHAKCVEIAREPNSVS
jgi:hypothetical protein